MPRMPLPSELTELEPEKLAQGALALYAKRANVWRQPQYDTYFVATTPVDDEERVDLLVILLPKAKAVTVRARLERLDLRVRQRRVVDLRRGRTRPRLVFPASEEQVPTTVVREADLVAALHEAWPALDAWRIGPTLFGGGGVDQPEALLHLLEKELIADRHTRLNATGGDLQRQTRLARVFVDLRVEESGETFLQSTLASAAQPEWSGRRPLDGGRAENRIVLVGGPGQGKTTLGTYLCQLHRAALIAAHPGSSEPDTAAIAEAVLESTSERIRAKRIPIRVVLHRFADDLATNRVTDLWGWLANNCNLQTETKAYSRELLSSWFARWPLLLVFDGLDEVPETANRGPVLAAIRSFLGDLERADLFVVITTRPQGYRGEFGSEGWTHLEIQEFTRDEAVDYAKRLFAEWQSGDRVRQAELEARTRRAVSEPLAEQLAKSPLQVVILCVLLEQSGRAPRDRWRLYKEYYRIISARERERGIPAVEVLEAHPELIERLHAEVAFILHRRAEVARGTSSGMDEDEFERVIRRLLVLDGHPHESIEEMTPNIRRAALHRLVLLVPVADQIGFEIRSLQEFHAGERLFWGEESLLPRRMEAIAGTQHWRNVLLFVAGHIASERAHLLPRVVSLCAAVDAQEGGLGAEASLGAGLATDLLTEGSVRGRPKIRDDLRKLATHALSPAEVSNARGWWFNPAVDPGQRFALLMGDLGVLDQLTRRLLDDGLSAAAQLTDLRFPHWPLRTLLDHLPERPGLTVLFVDGLARGLELPATPLPSLPPGPASTLLALAKVAATPPPAASDLLPAVMAALDHFQDAEELLARILDAHRPRMGVELIGRLLRSGKGDFPHLRHSLGRLLSSRPTPLQSRSVALDLELPAIDLEEEAVAGTPAEGPTWIAGLELSNLRGWEHLKLSFPRPPKGGQWIFFVGENGTGKTTLLRGLALSLARLGVAQRLVTETPGDLVRYGGDEASVVTSLGDGTGAKMRLVGQNVVPNGEAPEVFVLGYGVRRGTVLGVTKREVSFRPGKEVETLFIEGGDIIHGETWLQGLALRATKDPREADVLDAVKRLLCRLLPGVDEIRLDLDGVRVTGSGVGDVPLRATSDGYLTTAGWVIDLVARYMERERAAQRMPGPNFNRDITGLVLIDEVDLNLHPHWQWSLVEGLREMFPRLSFVVTTHNPVTLLGARREEVWVIDREPSGRLRAVQRDIEPGTDAAELLTGWWFGLPSIVDRNTMRLLDEHRAALRKDPDGEEARTLEATLRKRLRRFADTSLERMAASVAANVLQKRADALTPEDRQRARERAKATLERLAQLPS